VQAVDDDAIGTFGLSPYIGGPEFMSAVHQVQFIEL